MIVECPSCSTRFNLDESRIGERGAKVRCSVCSHSFVVHARMAMDEITEVDASASLELDDAPTGRYTAMPDALDMGNTVPGGAAYQDNANTAPGAELISPNDLIEIDASEVSELEEVTDGYSAAELASAQETVTGVAALPSPAPETIDFEEVSGVQPSPLASSASPGGFDPFAHVATDGPPDPSAQLDGAADFESHATAVYDVGRLAQSPEAMPDAPDLERDVPGGLGPAEELEGPARAVYQSFSTEAAFTRSSQPPSGGRRVLSAVITALMLLGAVAGGFFALMRSGRLDPAALGLDRFVELRTPPPPGGYLDVYPARVRSMLYPTRVGNELLVVTGEVENRSAEERAELDVLAYLVGPENSIEASGRSPIGVTFEVRELATMVDRRALTELLESKTQAGFAGPIAPGERRHFMVVMPSPPNGVRDLEHRVKIVPSAFARPSETAARPAEPHAESRKAESTAAGEGRGGKVAGTKKKRRRGKQPRANAR